MKAKANYFRTLVVLAVGLLVAVAVALFGVGLRSAETQTTTPEMQVQDLGHLGGGYSGATGINDSGQVVGVSSTSDGKQHAFLYDASATPEMQDLGTLGSYGSEARGINDFGQVVGQADDPEYWELFGVCGNDACQRAFLYDESANPKMQNLGTLLGDIIPMAVYGSGDGT
jgi:probable HAF family extracellular repeat protein